MPVAFTLSYENQNCLHVSSNTEQNCPWLRPTDLEYTSNRKNMIWFAFEIEYWSIRREQSVENNKRK